MFVIFSIILAFIFGVFFTSLGLYFMKDKEVPEIISCLYLFPGGFCLISGYLLLCERLAIINW